MKKSLIIIIMTTIILSGIGVFLYFYLNSFKKRIVRIAIHELGKWNSLTELSQNASQLLIKYWQSVGLNFSASQMQNSSVQSNYPWSSAFISWLFYKAGAKDKFPYASAHSGYFLKAKQWRNNPNAPLRGFRITEYSPKVGDLIVYSRQSGKGYDSTGFFPSHGELVIETGKGYVKAVGGNVGNSVKLSKYTTDNKGFLTQTEQSFFMVIQNNIN